MDIVSRAATDAYLRDKLGDQMPQGGTPAGLISDVSIRLAHYTGRKDWGPRAERTQYLDGGTSLLLMNYWPVTAVTSIHDDTDHLWPDSTALDSTDFFISTKNDGVIQIENWQLVQGYQNARVIYTAGYTSAADATIPDAIKRAAYMQITYEVQSQIPGRFTEVPGNFETAEFDDFDGIGLLGEVRTLLDEFKREVPFA